MTSSGVLLVQEGGVLENFSTGTDLLYCPRVALEPIHQCLLADRAVDTLISSHDLEVIPRHISGKVANDKTLRRPNLAVVGQNVEAANRSLTGSSFPPPGCRVG